MQDEERIEAHGDSTAKRGSQRLDGIRRLTRQLASTTDTCRWLSTDVAEQLSQRTAIRAERIERIRSLEGHLQPLEQAEFRSLLRVADVELAAQRRLVELLKSLGTLGVER